jgi:hypothetical protein
LKKEQPKAVVSRDPTFTTNRTDALNAVANRNLAYLSKTRPEQVQKTWKGWVGNNLQNYGATKANENSSWWQKLIGLGAYAAGTGLSVLQGNDNRKRYNKEKQSKRFVENEEERKNVQETSIKRTVDLMKQRYSEYMRWRQKAMKDIGIMEAERQGNQQSQIDKVKRDFRMHEWQQQVQQQYNPLIQKHQETKYEKEQKENQKKIVADTRKMDEGISGWLQYKTEFQQPMNKPKGSKTMTTEALGRYAQKKMADLSLRNSLKTFFAGPLNPANNAIDVQKTLGIKLNAEVLREINATDVSYIMDAGRIAGYLQEKALKAKWWKKALDVGLGLAANVGSLVSMASPLHPLVSTVVNGFNKHISPWKESGIYKSFEKFLGVRNWLDETEKIMGAESADDNDAHGKPNYKWIGQTVLNFLWGNQLGVNYEPFLRDREQNWLKDKYAKKEEIEKLINNNGIYNSNKLILENLKKIESREGVMQYLNEARKAEQNGRFNKELRRIPPTVRESKHGVIDATTPRNNFKTQTGQ